jgi:hypothetical protein
MADATYQPKVYRDSNGNRQVVASGGIIKVESGGIIDLESGGYLTSALSHAELRTVLDSKQVRINSRDFTQTSGSSIGFQSKPAQAATSTGSVIGCEISPRVDSGFACGNVIGAHVNAYLKGTAAGTISGDVRGLNVELITDDAGVRDIGGNVSAIRIRAAFSGGTVSGKISALRVEKMEAQTNSKQWDALIELPSICTGVWNSDPGTEISGSITGYIKVRVNGADRYIALYPTGPTD